MAAFKKNIDTHIIIKKITEQLNISRSMESQVILNKDDVEILGSYKEPDNPMERLIVLVKLNTPYIDLLGNIKYKIPFYMSSGKYSLGKEGTFQPFLGIFGSDIDKNVINNILLYLEKNLKIPPEEALSNDKTYKYYLERREAKSTAYKLFTTPNFMKCEYIHVIKNLFESEQPKIIINNQTIFNDNYSRIKGKNIKLCNEYLEKYSQALSTYFNKNRINIDAIEKFRIDQINDLIDINSIFGLNLNIISTYDINYSFVMEKINYYYSKFESSKSDDVIKKSESIQNTFEYLKEGEILPSEMDLIRFYNAYYNSKNQDHKRVVNVIKDSLDLSLR